jgi:hypothetical protein
MLITNIIIILSLLSTIFLSSPIAITAFINGRIFPPGASQDDFVSSMVISGERTLHVGLDSTSTMLPLGVQHSNHLW